jgi:hypothetical protein
MAISRDKSPGLAKWLAMKIAKGASVPVDTAS